ncbi:MAG TPA: thioredoxin domain-containing protein [Kineosporiaceae bacterium]|nr:thioredoxin domain-containing protein [Kineosporiaceae bacterium]
MSLVITSDAGFAHDVLASPTPVLVDFTADWCPPCRMIVPTLEKIADDERDRLRVVSIDVDANPATPVTYGVIGMPTLALFVDGEIVARIMGARPHAAIMRELEPHLQRQARPTA